VIRSPATIEMFVTQAASTRTPLYNVCTKYVQRMYNVVYNVEHYVEHYVEH